MLSVPFVAAHSRGMQYITGLMELLLEISPVGVDDDFFELGGHSLLVTQLTSRLERDFNVHIDLLTLMENPNPRNIYAHIAAQLGRRQPRNSLSVKELNDERGGNRCRSNGNWRRS